MKLICSWPRTTVLLMFDHSAAAHHLAKATKMSARRSDLYYNTTCHCTVRKPRRKHRVEGRSKYPRSSRSKHDGSTRMPISGNNGEKCAVTFRCRLAVKCQFGRHSRYLEKNRKRREPWYNTRNNDDLRQGGPWIIYDYLNKWSRAINRRTVTDTIITFGI